MDIAKPKREKSSILKKLECYLSMKKPKSSSSSNYNNSCQKSISSDAIAAEPKKQKLAPEGCFPVYVGPERQRFIVKTKYANHPLFKMLLEDAETEYGYNSGGPLLLPCDVDLFYKVLAEMECWREKEREIHPAAGFGFVYGACSPFSPARRRLGRGSEMAKGFSYEMLTPSRLLKMNY